MNSDLARIKLPLNKERNSSVEHTKKGAPVLQKNTGSSEGEVELGGIEKTKSTFNLQRELEKVKISIPLTELLKQPTYKDQVSQFMLPLVSSPTQDSPNLQ